MASYFTPPQWVFNDIQGVGDRSRVRLFGRMKYDRVGYSVYRDASGAYFQVISADDDVVKTSTEYYMGGRSYQITAQNVTDLTAAGYGAYITATVP